MSTTPAGTSAPPATARARLGMFGSLRHRQFALLWTGGVGQSIGMGMQQITIGHYVYARTGSEFWVGAVAFMNFAPFFLLSPVAGAIGDRVDRRRLLIVTQAGSGLAILALAALIMAKQAAIWHVMVVTLFAATGQTLSLPVRFAFIGELVAREYLMNAIALNSLAQNGMRIIGPVVAGTLIGVIGSGGTMCVNAGGYLAGTVPLLLLAHRPAIARGPHIPVLRTINEGLRYAAATPAILFILMLTNIFSLFGMPYNSMLPVFAEDVLLLDARGLGYLTGAGGLGSVLGGFLLARLGDYPHKARLFQGFYVLFFAALIAFALSSSYLLSLCLLVLVGMGSMSHINMGTVMLQLRTPQELQGRIMSLWTWPISFAFLGALPIGALAEVYGAPRVMAGSGAVGLAFGTALMVWARRRGGTGAEQTAPAPQRSR